MSKTTQKEKELRAHSIAGEALACYLLDFQFRNVKFETGIIRVSSNLNETKNSPLKDRIEVEKLVMTLIFAAISEAKKRLEPTEFKQTNLELNDDAYVLLSLLCKTDEENEALLKLLINKTLKLWNTKQKVHNGDIVEKIAKILLAGEILTIYDIEYVYQKSLE